MIGYAVYLHTQLNKLRNEVENMHRNLTQPTVPAAQSSVQSHAPGIGEVAPSGTVPSFTPNIPAAPVVPQQSAFIAWVKEDFLVKVGALLLLIAFGWFVNYAFANDWIGPFGRIALGLIVGVSIMALGIWRIQTQLHQGGIFTVLGSTTVLLTIFAARQVYEFFTPTTALVLMFMSVAFVAFVSVRYRSDQLALAGLILAAIAPFMTNPPEPSVIGLFTYLLMVVVGTLWVVYLTGSHTLTFASLLLASFYSVPFWLDGVAPEEKLIGLVFAFAFTTIFFITNVISIAHNKNADARQGQVLTALLTGVYLVGWVGLAAPGQWQSILYIAWMLVFSSGAFVVYAYTSYRVPFYIYSAVSIGLLAAATAVELDGPFLTVVYSMEALVIVCVSVLLLKDIQLSERLCFLFIGPALLSLEHISSRLWRDGFIHEDFFALLVLSVSLGVVGLVLHGAQVRTMRPTQVPFVMSVAGLGYFLLIVWLVTHSILGADTATTVSLLVYTVLGITFFVRGKLADNRSVMLLGGVLLSLVVARLLLIDVWQMDLAGRVITFGAVGILLISTAFFGKNTKSEILHD